MNVRSLASGSSGNALIVQAGDATIAIDCGVGPRMLAQSLRPLGMRPGDLAGVLLTHEHGDHIRAMPQLVSAGVGFLATAGTARAARLPQSVWQPVQAFREVCVDRFQITPLAVSHDAAEPCGYFLKVGENALAVITDLGEASPALIPYLAAADLIVLEANHDLDLLRRGPYPAHLKRRVLSSHGHLSNDDCGRLLVSALTASRRQPTVWLAHLSTTNNRPALARQTVMRALAAAGHEVPVVALPRYDEGTVWVPDATPSRSSQLRFDLSIG